MCTTLPVLKNLTIRSASPVPRRGSKYRDWANLVRARMRVWIAQNLGRYGPITPNHAFHVSVFWTEYGTEYAVRRDDLGANLGTDPSHELRKTDP